MSTFRGLVPIKHNVMHSAVKLLSLSRWAYWKLRMVPAAVMKCSENSGLFERRAYGAYAASFAGSPSSSSPARGTPRAPRWKSSATWARSSLIAVLLRTQRRCQFLGGDFGRDQRVQADASHRLAHPLPTLRFGLC